MSRARSGEAAASTTAGSERAFHKHVACTATTCKYSFPSGGVVGAQLKMSNVLRVRNRYKKYLLKGHTERDTHNRVSARDDIIGPATKGRGETITAPPTPQANTVCTI